MSTFEKDTTLISDVTVCDSVAVTVMLDTCAGANARQISEVPFCSFWRFTSVQVRVPLAMLVTVGAVALTWSVEMNASSSSFGCVVVTPATATVLLFVSWSFDLLTSTIGDALTTFDTVTETVADVVMLPAASRALAESACAPLDTGSVFQAIVNGAAVSSAPSAAPSSRNCTPATPTLSAADAVTVTAEPDTVVPSAGAVTDTVGAVRSLLTVTRTSAAVAVLPAPSRATALSVWLPLAPASVFQLTEYGAAVSSAPRLTPSSLNCTPTTAMLSAAFALTATAPSTVAPAAGALMETVGTVPSTLLTVTGTAADVVLLPAASRATAVSVWLPFVPSVVFQLTW